MPDEMHHRLGRSNRAAAEIADIRFRSGLDRAAALARSFVADVVLA